MRALFEIAIHGSIPAFKGVDSSLPKGLTIVQVVPTNAVGSPDAGMGGSMVRISDCVCCSRIAAAVLLSLLCSLMLRTEVDLVLLTIGYADGLQLLLV